jgi:hypothetical protein
MIGTDTGRDHAPGNLTGLIAYLTWAEEDDRRRNRTARDRIQERVSMDLPRYQPEDMSGCDGLGG